MDLTKICHRILKRPERKRLMLPLEVPIPTLGSNAVKLPLLGEG